MIGEIGIVHPGGILAPDYEIMVWKGGCQTDCVVQEQSVVFPTIDFQRVGAGLVRGRMSVEYENLATSIRGQ